MSSWSQLPQSIFGDIASTKTQSSKSTSSTAAQTKSESPSDQATVLALSPEMIAAKAKEAAVAQDWEIGDVILDLYEVKSILGEGGMGKVYCVQHQGWNVDLAVKAPRPEIFTEAGVKESFISEAETWVNLGLHPHIVTCYYVRTLGDIPRVFAEYIEGGSLADWIYDRRLYAGEAAALERIIDVAIQFAWGLHFAHQQGLIHRDVKPGNVMMTAEGIAKVTDFGLARSILGIETQDEKALAMPNRPATVRGMTPAYCSPEQARGETLSLQTDVWSWAVSVLEMFTGEVTWQVGQVVGEVLEAYLESGPVDPALPQMPAALAGLLRRSFRADPAERPLNMKEVAETLQAIYHEVIGQDYPRTQPRAGQGTADSLNNRALSLLDLGKVKEAEAAWEAALAADLKHPETIFNYGMLRWRRGEITDAALIRQLESVRAVYSNDWRIDYFFSLFNLERGDITSSLRFLDAASRKSPESIELQKALTLAQSGKISDNSPARKLTMKLYSLGTCMFSADGQRLLTVTDNDWIHFWETASGSCCHTEKNRGPIRFATLSDDGRLALTGDSNCAQLWDSQTGETLRVSKVEQDDTSFARKLTEHDPESRRSYLQRALKIWLPIIIFSLITGVRSDVLAWLVVLMLFLIIPSINKYKEELRKQFMSQRSHQIFIQRACLSSDGHHVLTWNAHPGMRYETLKYWSTITGECLYTLEENTGDSTTFKLSRGTGMMDRRAGWVLRFFLASQYEGILKFLIRIRRPKTEAEIASTLDISTLQLPSEGQVGVVVAQFLSQDGRYALTGSDDHTVRLYDLRMKRRLRSFKGHDGAVKSVCLSGDSRFVLSGSDDATVRLWDVASGRCLKIFNGHEAEVNSVCFSGDARYALSGGGDKTVRLWDVKTGCCVRAYLGHDDQVLSATLVEGGRLALSAGTDSSLLLWKIPERDGELFPAQLSRVRATAEVIEHEGQVRDLLERGEAARQEAVFDDALAFARQARQTPGFERMKQSLAEWEKLSLYCQRVGIRSIWPAKILEQHTSSISAVCLSGDGHFAFSGNVSGKFGGGSGTLCFWDVSEGQSLKKFEWGEAVYCVGLSANGDWGVSGGVSGELILWNFRRGHYQRSFSGHTQAITGVAISRDGRYVLSCSLDKTLRLWDADSGNCLRVTGGTLNALYSVCISPTGRYALSGELNGFVRLWDLATGRCLLTINGHGQCVNSVCISDDERFVLSASNDKTIRLWELKNSELVHVFDGHTGAVTSACFSSDGRYMLSGSADKTLRLWEIETGQCLHVFEGHTNAVTSVTFSPNARYAISSSSDGTLRLWEIDWELKARELMDWDEGARPILESFLLTHTPMKAAMPLHQQPSQRQIKRALTRTGKPVWNEQDFQLLIRQLQYAGYGWLRPEGVESKLKEMAAGLYQPPAPIENQPSGLDNLLFSFSNRLHRCKQVLSPYASLFGTCGVILGIVFLYMVFSSVSQTNDLTSRSVYIPYNVSSTKGSRIIEPYPQTPVVWGTYKPGNHDLSVDLPTAPTLTYNNPTSDPQLVSNEHYDANSSEYMLFIGISRLVLVTKVQETPKLLLLEFLKPFHKQYGGDSSDDQFKLRAGGGMTATGTLMVNGRRVFFKVLVLKRGSEVWFLTVGRVDSYNGKEAEDAVERIINSVRF